MKRGTAVIQNHSRPFINDSLQREFETNECQCDSCSSEVGGDECGLYHDQKIVHIRKTNIQWLWCFESDLNYSKY